METILQGIGIYFLIVLGLLLWFALLEWFSVGVDKRRRARDKEIAEKERMQDMLREMNETITLLYYKVCDLNQPQSNGDQTK